MTEYIDVLVKRATDLQERKRERRQKQEEILKKYEPLKKIFWAVFWELKEIYFKKSENSWFETKMFKIDSELFGLNMNDEDADESYDGTNSISWKIKLQDVTKEHVIEAINVINDHFDEYRRKKNIKSSMEKVDITELLDKYEKTKKVKENFEKINEEIEKVAKKINNIFDDLWFSNCKFLVYEEGKTEVFFKLHCGTCSFKVYNNDQEIYKDYKKFNLYNIPIFDLEEIKNRVLEFIEKEIEKKEKEENEKNEKNI